MSTRKIAVCCRIASWSNLVQWQPPDGSRLASGFLVGTDAIILFLITRADNKKDVTTHCLYINYSCNVHIPICKFPYTLTSCLNRFSILGVHLETRRTYLNWLSCSVYFMQV